MRPHDGAASCWPPSLNSGCSRNLGCFCDTHTHTPAMTEGGWRQGTRLAASDQKFAVVRMGHARLEQWLRCLRKKQRLRRTKAAVRWWSSQAVPGSEYSTGREPQNPLRGVRQAKQRQTSGFGLQALGQSSGEAEPGILGPEASTFYAHLSRILRPFGRRTCLPGGGGVSDISKIPPS